MSSTILRLATLARRRAVHVTLGLALLGLGTGCAIPADLVQTVAQGASDHAAQHLAAGEPAAMVLCPVGTVLEGASAATLIPSRIVARFGCHLGDLRATATTCVATGIDGPLAGAPWDAGVMCSDLGFDEGPAPILQPATIDPPGHLGA